MFADFLPDVGSLGVYAYWLIFLFAFLDAAPVLCLFIPGALAVIFGGVFVKNGALDIGDVFWFAVAGNFLGSATGYFLGRRFSRVARPIGGPILTEMAQTVRKYGPLSLLFGNFLGPLSGFFPFFAALTKMPPKNYVMWSFFGALVFSAALMGFGYYFADVITMLAALAGVVNYGVLALFLVLFVIWWIVISLKFFWPDVKRLLVELSQSTAQKPRIARWRDAHPKTDQFLRNRFHIRDFSGLALTLFIALFVYLITLWIDSSFGYLRSNFVVELDERLALLMHAYWEQGYIDFLTTITNLGNNKTIIIFLIAVEIFLLSKGRYAIAAGLLVAVLGDFITVDAMKNIFARPRPYGGYYIEKSYSFPSGHAGISVAFYGTLAYALWRVRAAPLYLSLGVAASLAALIGFSRIYLLEHYLSDVLNGWTVGAIWMCIGIVMGERWALGWRDVRRLKFSPWVNVIPTALVVYGFVYVFTYDPPHRYTPSMLGIQGVPNVEALFTEQKLSVTTESIAGTPFEPINVIIIASGDHALTELFAKNGWSLARPAGVRSLSRAAISAWTKSPRCGGR